MDKRGAELSMNVIIIAILVLLVLVVLGYFFLGGSTKIFQGINQFTSDNLENARNDCSSRCQLAQNYETNDQKINSGYCKKQINYDKNNDNIADEKVRCYSSYVNIQCPGVSNLCTYEATEILEK
jgi:flagellar basal body-associated protein FliL